MRQMIQKLFEFGPDCTPANIEEKLVYWTIAGSWGLYFAGAIFTVPPIVGYVLVFISVRRLCGFSIETEFVRRDVPWMVLVWFAAMGVMLVALLVGHMDFKFGAPEIVKSVIGWMKGWMLIALFIFVGATMKIRSAIIVRASSVLALQTLLLLPIFILAPLLHIPNRLFMSPFILLGGAAPEFFIVELYGIEPMTGAPRWRFFAPWAPAAGLVASMGFVFALYERSRLWMGIAIAGALAIALMSSARMAMVAIPAVPVAVFVLSNMTVPSLYIGGSAMIAAAIPFLTVIQSTVEDMTSRFLNARSDSTRVRATLQRIAQHRWAEAPTWGHATVEKGPHLVEYMPIGTHHTWNGLLFVKGSVGFGALFVPVVWTVVELVLKAQADRTARLALGQFLIVLLFSFGENLESLIYLYWPAMVLAGRAASRRPCNPFVGWLGRPVAA